MLRYDVGKGPYTVRASSLKSPTSYSLKVSRLSSDGSASLLSLPGVRPGPAVVRKTSPTYDLADSSSLRSEGLSASRERLSMLRLSHLPWPISSITSSAIISRLVREEVAARHRDTTHHHNISLFSRSLHYLSTTEVCLTSGMRYTDRIGFKKHIIFIKKTLDFHR